MNYSKGIAMRMIYRILGVTTIHRIACFSHLQAAAASLNRL